MRLFKHDMTLADFIQWFIDQGCLDELYALFKEGCLKIYDYSFMTAAILKEGVYSIWNIQDPIQIKENTFERRYLYHKSIETLFPKARNRSKLYNEFRGNIIEVKAEEFGSAIENAKDDFKDRRRNQLILQAFVDEIYKVQNLGRPPEVIASVISNGSKHHLNFNISFEELKKMTNGKLNFHGGVPLTASAHSNRLIWSALSMKCDLFLPQPMSYLVGDKLYESKEKISKSGEIIETLKAKVEFPDIREVVNNGQIGLEEVLRIRKKSTKFRSWLQQENERDRDAIIAYHNEVSKELGFKKFSRKAISLFGLLGGGAVGGVIGSTVAGPLGGALGGLAGSSLSYLTNIGSKLGENWKPIIFGNWLKERIEKIVKEQV